MRIIALNNNSEQKQQHFSGIKERYIFRQTAKAIIPKLRAVIEDGKPYTKQLEIQAFDAIYSKADAIGKEYVKRKDVTLHTRLKNLVRILENTKDEDLRKDVSGLENLPVSTKQ